MGLSISVLSNVVVLSYPNPQTSKTPSVYNPNTMTNATVARTLPLAEEKSSVRANKSAGMVV
ncbi:hypothetical protein PM082_014520 [Marasmius tenuissimus]|nr:hypothetical protein PM082_014520 [Marasmius tenuissimus]